MKTLFRLTTILFLASAISFAQTNEGEPKSKRISIRQHPDYQHVLVALRTLVAEKAKYRKNTFYISKLDVRVESGEELYLADVYWKEDNSIILLESNPSDWEHALLWSRRYWRLDKDVVPTLADVAGSNYLLTRADARRMIMECLRGGRIVIYKGASNRSTQGVVAQKKQSRVNSSFS